MKKQYRAIILTLMFVFLLTGCMREDSATPAKSEMKDANNRLIVQGTYYDKGTLAEGMFLYNITTRERVLLSEKSIAFFSNLGNRMLLGIIETEEFHGIGTLNLNSNEYEYLYSFDRLDKELPATHSKQMYGFAQANHDMDKIYFPYSKYLVVYDRISDEVSVLEEYDYIGTDCFYDENNQEIYHSYRGIMAYQIEQKTSRAVLDAVVADLVVSSDGTLYYADRKKEMICKYKDGTAKELVELNMKIPYLDLSLDETKLLYFTAIDNITGTYTPVVMQYDFDTGRRQELYRPSKDEWVQQAVWDD